MRDNIYVLAKIKFDLRDPEELYFAQREIDSLLGTKTKFIKTLATPFRDEPFNKLDEEIIHLITRLVYLGEGQGFLANIPPVNIVNIIKKATFFREIYVVFKTENVKNIFNKIGIDTNIELDRKRVDPNPYTQVFLKEIEGRNKLVTIRFLPFHTLFEYATEIKKLPACVFKSKNSQSWKEYFTEKESGVEKGLKELITHLKDGHYRSPHFGLG